MWEETGQVEKVQKPLVLCTILRPMLQSEVELNSRMISGGLCVQHFGVEVGFPARDWDGSQEWEHQILVTRPVFSDKGPGPLALQKRIPQRWKVVKQMRYLLRGKRIQCMWIETLADLGKEWVTESHPFDGLNFFYGVFLLGFLWPILICLAHSPYLVYIRILLYEYTHLLAKMDFAKKVAG